MDLEELQYSYVPEARVLLKLPHSSACNGNSAGSLACDCFLMEYSRERMPLCRRVPVHKGPRACFGTFLEEKGSVLGGPGLRKGVGHLRFGAEEQEQVLLIEYSGVRVPLCRGSPYKGTRGLFWHVSRRKMICFGKPGFAMRDRAFQVAG